jgi:E3 ubiquitin-protein ligase TRIP12
MDKDLGNVLLDLAKVINFKKEHLKTAMDLDGKDLNDCVLYNYERLDFLGLTFNIPGYSDIEMKKDGLDTLVDAYNINEYVSLVFDALYGSGINEIVDEFTNGFNLVFPISNLKCFTSHEIEDILSGNSDEDWNHETLTEYIIPNHGYNKFR